MNKKLITWQIIGVFVIMALASLWHFVYAWIPSGVSATIFPVNESPWEHVKLLLIPAVLYYTLQYLFVGKQYKNYIFGHGIVLVVMPALTLGLFYFYRKVLLIPESLILDIIITFVVIAVGSLLAYRITVGKKDVSKLGFLAPVILVVLFTAYSILTFFTPKQPIFMDTNVNEYGMVAAELLHSGEHSHGGENDHEDEHGEDEAHEDEHDEDHE